MRKSYELLIFFVIFCVVLASIVLAPFFGLKTGENFKALKKVISDKNMNSLVSFEKIKNNTITQEKTLEYLTHDF